MAPKARRMTEVVNLAEFKAKKEAEKQPDDFGERLARIKASLEKIDRLMANLKRMNREGI